MSDFVNFLCKNNFVTIIYHSCRLNLKLELNLESGFVRQLPDYAGRA